MSGLNSRRPGSTVADLQARVAALQFAPDRQGAIVAAFENLQDAVGVFDHDGRPLGLSRAYRTLLGALDQDLANLRGRADIVWASPLYRPDNADRRTLGEAYLNLSSPGRLDQFLPCGRILSLSRMPVPGVGVIDTLHDVTEDRAALDNARYYSRHDALTGLPNRTILAERLHEATAAAQGGELSAIVSLDLDRFKAVNDTLGHSAGDLLLAQVARRLQDQLREPDTAVRLGGDEFALLHRRLGRADEALSIVRRIVEEISRPYLINGQVVVVGASAGIELIDGGRANADKLLANADMALYRAKAAGRGMVRFFAPEMQIELNSRRDLEVDLRDALLQRRLLLHYQPQIDMESGEILALEALVRWPHPRRGLLAPAEFITLAEQSGLMGELGAQILQMACSEAARWRHRARVCVNISAAQFLDGVIVEQVRMALAATGLAAARLELEIAEALILAGGEQALATLQALKALGVRITLDNLSLGPSFISYATRGVFDGVKIDASWVPEPFGQASAGDVIAAFAVFCRTLGLRSALSGVEGGRIAERVSHTACDAVQGFAFAEPVPATEVEGLLATPPMTLAHRRFVQNSARVSGR